MGIPSRYKVVGVQPAAAVVARTSFSRATGSGNGIKMRLGMRRRAALTQKAESAPKIQSPRQSPARSENRLSHMAMHDTTVDSRPGHGEEASSSCWGIHKHADASLSSS